MFAGSTAKLGDKIQSRLKRFGEIFVRCVGKPAEFSGDSLVVT